MAEVAVLKDKKLRKFINEIDKRATQAGAKGAAKAGVKSQFIRGMSAIVFQDVQNHFQEQHGRGNKPWQDWSPLYKKSQALRGRSSTANILKDTGRLRNAFIPTNVRASTQGFVWFNPAKVNGFPYAAAHDEGRGRLPQREFMWLSGKALSIISKFTAKFLAGE